MSNNDNSGDGNSGSGLNITAVLSYGGQSVTASTQVAGASTSVTSASLSFPAFQANATDTNMTLTVTLTAIPPAPPDPVPPVDLPVEAADAAILCDTDDSQMEGVSYVLGPPGDGDIDGDSIPDSEDADRDGDGVAQEEGLQCTLNGQDVSFADRADLQPDDHDQDQDGHTDEEECAAGSDPFSLASTPPEEAGFPWVLVILLLVIIVLIAAIVFAFLKFGRIVELDVVSQAELIVDPGKTGKFEIAAQSLRKKGDPVTFQIQLAPVPEGWDATTDVDHVALEHHGEEGSRKTFWLTVEAPGHGDPESALVAVKAVPLNKQGRKDTFKVAGKVSTITSINVPPDAKVPVKKGGPVKLKSPEEAEAPEAAPIPAEGLPVEDLPGLGPANAKKLKAEGIETTEELRTAELEPLAKKTKIGSSDLERWQHMSDLVRVPGVSPGHAEALVDGGIESSGDLAAMKPEDLMERVNANLMAKEAS
jgi:predicted flap endonuclease-1-like 5' DNA nuclease